LAKLTLSQQAKCLHKVEQSSDLVSVLPSKQGPLVSAFKSIYTSAASTVKVLATSTARLGVGRNGLDIAKDKEVLPQNQTFVKEASNQPRNNPRLAWITVTYLQKAGEFENKIFPSLDTWLSGDDNPTYYVVMNEMWQQNYTRLCETNENYCSRIQVLWTSCDEGHFGRSPCCKMQQGLIQMLDHHSEDYDYFAYLDNDDYIRRRYIEKLISGMDASEPFVLSSGRFGGVSLLGQPGYLDSEEREYACRTDPQFQYAWGQPVIYSRGALEKIAPGLRLEGFTKQCAEYKITHDVGVQVFNWMYSLPELRIRTTEHPVQAWRGDYVAMHNVGSDKKKGKSSFYEVEERYQKLEEKFNMWYNWNNVTGFHETQTFCDHGDPSKWTTSWHTMPVKDCLANLTLSQQAKCLHKEEQSSASFLQ
jgi:hypothetical protein